MDQVCRAIPAQGQANVQEEANTDSPTTRAAVPSEERSQEFEEEARNSAGRWVDRRQSATHRCIYGYRGWKGA